MHRDVGGVCAEVQAIEEGAANVEPRERPVQCEFVTDQHRLTLHRLEDRIADRLSDGPVGRPPRSRLDAPRGGAHPGEPVDCRAAGWRRQYGHRASPPLCATASARTARPWPRVLSRRVNPAERGSRIKRSMTSNWVMSRRVPWSRTLILPMFLDAPPSIP